jgi:hypothetical protein
MLLVEMLVYIGIVSILTTLLSLIGTSLLRSYAYMSANQRIAEAGALTLDTITRSVRASTQVALADSTLNSHPGRLTMELLDSAGTTHTHTFTVTDGRVTQSVDSGPAIPLTQNGMSVSDLRFLHTVGTETQGVYIEMTLSQTIRSSTITTPFRTFVVLDAS